MNKFTQLQEELNNHTIEFVEIQFPMWHEKDNVFNIRVIENQNKEYTGKFKVTDTIAITLRNLTGYQVYDKEGKFKRKYAFSYSEIKDWFKNSEWHKFAQLQSFKNKYIDVNEKMLNTTYHAAIFDGEIVGIYNNYNGVQHQQLLDYIKEYGLSNRVSSYSLTPNNLTVNLHIHDDTNQLEDSSYLYDLVFTNRLDSWEGLNFYVMFKFRDLEIELQFDESSKRHLSNVEQIFIDVKQYLEKMYQLNFTKTLEDTSAYDLLEIMNLGIDKTNDKMVELASIMKNHINSLIQPNAKDFFEEMAYYRNKHGYKMASQELGWFVMNKLFNLD